MPPRPHQEGCFQTRVHGGPARPRTARCFSVWPLLSIRNGSGQPRGVIKACQTPRRPASATWKDRDGTAGPGPQPRLFPEKTQGGRERLLASTRLLQAPEVGPAWRGLTDPPRSAQQGPEAVAQGQWRWERSSGPGRSQPMSVGSPCSRSKRHQSPRNAMFLQDALAP